GAIGHSDDAQGDTGLLEFLTEQELMRQLAAQAVQVIDKDGLHQPLPHEVTELGKLRPVKGRTGVVIDKDMGVWHGVAFLPCHGLTGLNLGRERKATVGLVRGRDTGIDGRDLWCVGGAGALRCGGSVCYDSLRHDIPSLSGMLCKKASESHALAPSVFVGPYRVLLRRLGRS